MPSSSSSQFWTCCKRNIPELLQTCLAIGSTHYVLFAPARNSMAAAKDIGSNKNLSHSLRRAGLSCFSHLPMMECELLRVQITLTHSGLPRAWLYENQRCYLGNQRGKAFQKEQLVIFFNPLQLEIRNAVIKVQLLWLPTFVPAAVAEAPPPSQPLLFF